MKKKEKYSERFSNKENEVASGIFNTENWGKRTMVMTPKEKAEELVHRYDLMQTYVEGFGLDNAKHCALIAVTELMFESSFEFPNIRQKYWQQVKEEINNL